MEMSSEGRWNGIRFLEESRKGGVWEEEAQSRAVTVRLVQSPGPVQGAPRFLKKSDRRPHPRSEQEHGGADGESGHSS